MVTAILIASLLAQPLPLRADPGQIVLPSGAAVTVHATEDITSGKAKTGDTVYFTVQNPVVVNGVTVIAAGAQARGRVDLSKHASGFGRNGKLQISIHSVAAVDGTQIPLRASQEQRGGNNAALSVGVIVFVSILGVFIQGREAVIKSSKAFDVFVDQPVTFRVTQAGPAAVDPPRLPDPASAPASGPPAASTIVLKTVACGAVDPQGQPLEVATTFQPGTSKIVIWWELEPAPRARSCEVRLYKGNRLHATSPATVAKSAGRGWAEIAPAAGFEQGEWHADLFEDGQKLATQYFKIQ